MAWLIWRTIRAASAASGSPLADSSSFELLAEEGRADEVLAQGVVEIVADPLALPLLDLQQLLLVPLAIGDVVQHLRESRQAAFGIAQGRQNLEAPELGPVLADPPVLVLENALGRGGGDGLVRLAGGAVPRRIQSRERRADHLVGPVAGQPLRPFVPGHDAARGVEHEDRPVLQVLRQAAYALLALAERFGGSLVPIDLLDEVGRPALDRLLQADRLPLEVRQKDAHDRKHGQLDAGVPVNGGRMRVAGRECIADESRRRRGERDPEPGQPPAVPGGQRDRKQIEN